ncbi:hypothetical protein [Conexibacter sp. SYSU D00693]|uniref:hypothetical protein n=1 Tax=Conexibacter sp. SYSU D00693 TaxID=2812560 RepID=UPI00196A6204|nr:hypothetical protein [Conexibacter sp. SYSU D00693]
MSRALALAATVLALVAAGCGGGADKDEYTSGFNRVDDRLQRTMQSISTDLSASTDTTLIARRLDTGAAALDQAAEDLDELDVPDDIAKQHDDIVDGVGDIADVFRKAAGEARQKDTRRLVRTIQGVESSEAAKKVDAAEKAIRGKGYEIRR